MAGSLAHRQRTAAVVAAVVVATALAVPVGVLTGSPRGWALGIAVGLVAGVASGVLLVVFGRRLQATMLGPDAAHLSPAQHEQAIRASQRGPVPEDPEVRAAAARLCEKRITDAPRAWVLFGVMGLLATGQAVVTSRWFWWLAALFALALLVSLAEPRLARRRLTKLTG